MFNFICRTLPHVKTSVKAPPFHKLFSIQYYHPLSLPSSSTLECISGSSNEHSFTISYLINTCEFPLEKALSASNYINFETPHRADTVLAFFKNQGFTKTQISNLVKRFPPILLFDPQKTLLPKLHFLNSIGLSSADLTKLITATPDILNRSLENRIIPSFKFLKTLLPSQEKVVSAIKRFNMLLGYDLQTYAAPNIEILRELGVPASNIIVLLTTQPKVVMTETEKFRKNVKEVEKMGLNPLRMKFLRGLLALRSMSKSTWEKKVEVYKKWGLSDDEIFVAFGKHPFFMIASENKIMGVMDFLVSKMGWESSVIVARPGLMSLSLSKRIVPRCLVYQLMLEKRLIKKDYSFSQKKKKEDYSLSTLLESTEKQFVNNIMKRYEKEAPELLKLYQQKLDLSK